MNNSSNERYKESKSLERDSQTQTQGYISRFVHQALRPRLHRVKDFYYLHQKTLQKIQTQSSTQEEVQRQGTKPMHKAITSIQEGRHKAKAQNKREWLQYLVITKATNNTSHNTRS